MFCPITKADFTKQTAHINTFKVGSSHLKKQIPLKKQGPKQAPQQQIHSKSFQSQSEVIFSQSQMASQRLEQQQNTQCSAVQKQKTRLLNKNSSSNSLIITTLEDQPTNLEVKLILILS